MISLDATATYVDDKREGSTDKTGFGRRGSLDVSCAVCVVGQLARLELQSKVRHTLALVGGRLADTPGGTTTD